MQMSDDGFLKSRADDLIELSRIRRRPQFLGFLDERQVFLLTAYLDHVHCMDYRFYGGYDSAVRCFLGIDYYGSPEPDAFPVTMVEFTFRRQDELSHRDFLGALMAFGIARECIGDILVSQGKAVVFLEQNIADFVLSQVQKIGRVGVKSKTVAELTLPVSEKFELLEGTVPSLRLDCITGLCTGLSRERTKALLVEKQVRLNYQICQNPSASVEENDKISIRGYGKFVLNTVGDFTKKGRRHVAIKHYI